MLINIYIKYKERKNGYLVKKDEFTNFLGIVIVLLFIIMIIASFVVLVMTYPDDITPNEILEIFNKYQSMNVLNVISMSIIMIYITLKIWKIEIFESGVVCNGKLIKWNLIDYFKIEIDNFGIYTVKINHRTD
jgi:magnesium-transporting ATPase (P-type)